MALIAGTAQAASLAWPIAFQAPALALAGLRAGEPVWWLQLLSLTLLAGLLQRCRSARQGALLGWLFGIAWLAGTVSWTFVAMHTYGGLPASLSMLAVLVLTGLMALFYAGACALYAAVRPAQGAMAALVFAALWLLAELARGTWLTGFGWGAVAYAHIDGPLAGYAPWLGVYGMCALAAWLAMHMAGAWRAGSAGQRLGNLPAALLVLGLPFLIAITMPAFSASSGRLSVTLLQGNIPQDEKFEPGSGVPLALDWYAQQLNASRTQLVIAPETAIALLPQQLPAGYWDALQQRFGSGGQAALLGIPLGNDRQGYTNSVLGLKPGQAQAWRYDKQHLVPFGEFIPPLFKWFTALMNIPLGDFNRGDRRQPPFDWQGQKLAANICYENLFGEELASQFAEPALVPTLFVNVSNLAWFGQGLAIDQHLQITRMRALEFERAFVLATNTGATAIVDHRARVVGAIARGSRSALVGEVEGRTGVTPYAWWVARFGLWPMWLAALALVWLAARGRLRKR
ncbi:MAG: apolipoprotein N-acyltransferase [Rhodoferax sp.]